MGIKEELGEKIKRMRVRRGMTQESLSEAINISQRALSAIERGENFVTTETVDKLLIALNTTSSELFATDHIKTNDELIEQINKNIAKITQNPEKLELIYKIINDIVND